MESEVDLAEFDYPDSNIDKFALEILSRVISLEERRMGKMSGLRGLDVSVYLDKRRETTNIS